jgi:hypothetical protein
MEFNDAGSEEEAFFCRLDQRSKKRHFAFQMFTQSPITIALRMRALLQHVRKVNVLRDTTHLSNTAPQIPVTKSV